MTEQLHPQRGETHCLGFIPAALRKPPTKATQGREGNVSARFQATAHHGGEVCVSGTSGSRSHDSQAQSENERIRAHAQFVCSTLL